MPTDPPTSCGSGEHFTLAEWNRRRFLASRRRRLIAHAGKPVTAALVAAGAGCSNAPCLTADPGSDCDCDCGGAGHGRRAPTTRAGGRDTASPLHAKEGDRVTDPKTGETGDVLESRPAFTKVKIPSRDTPVRVWRGDTWADHDEPAPSHRYTTSGPPGTDRQRDYAKALVDRMPPKSATSTPEWRARHRRNVESIVSATDNGDKLQLDYVKVPTTEGFGKQLESVSKQIDAHAREVREMTHTKIDRLDKESLSRLIDYLKS